MGFARFNVQMSHLDLRIRPREPFDSFENIDVVIFVGEHQDMFARMRHRRRKGKARRFVRLQAHALAQAEDRVEYRADGV